jgi:hypothetical protein
VAVTTSAACALSARSETLRVAAGECPFYETGRTEVKARSDSALSHPNPVVIEMRCKTPPRPNARRSAERRAEQHERARHHNG